MRTSVDNDLSTKIAPESDRQTEIDDKTKNSDHIKQEIKKEN